MGIKYYFFVLFVTSEASFVQLQVCISLVDHWRVVYGYGLRCQACAPFLILCLYSSMPHPVSPLLQSSAVVPGCCISLYKVTTLVVNILYTIAAFYCCLCKTVVVPHTNRNKTEGIYIPGELQKLQSHLNQLNQSYKQAKKS